jgi:hypothetical protein
MCAVRTPEVGRVIRVGVLQDGKIVLERRLDPGESLTVGNSPRAVVSAPIPSLPRRYALIEHRRGRYHLVVRRGMKGKLSHGGQLLSLDQLRDRPSTSRDRWELPLDDRDRGSVRVGDLTLLFQLVQAPPIAQRQLQRQSFRPRLLNDDDPVFMGFLGLFTVLAASFVAYTASIATPALIGDFEEVERFAVIHIPSPEVAAPDPVVPDPVIEDDALAQLVSEEVEPEPVEAVAKNDPPPSRPLTAEEARAAEIQAKADLREQVYAESAVLQWMITRGDSTLGEIAREDAWGVDGDIQLGGDPDLDRVANLVPSYKGGKGSGTDREDATITMDKLGSGDATITEATTGGPTGSIRTPKEGLPQGSPEAARVAASVKRYYGQVKTCYERRLKENPSLRGRVEVEFVVDGGRASEFLVLDNSTRDQELEDCIVHSMQYWQFDDDIVEFAVSYPFVLAPG